MYETMVNFQTLDKGQLRTETPENKQSEPYNSLTFPHGSSPWSQCREWESRESLWSKELRRQRTEFGETRKLEFSGQRATAKGVTQAWNSGCAQDWLRNDPKPGKETAERGVCRTLKLKQDWEQSVLQPARVNVLLLYGTLSKVPRRMLLQQWGKISLRLKTSLDPP